MSSFWSHIHYWQKKVTIFLAQHFEKNTFCTCTVVAIFFLNIPDEAMEKIEELKNIIFLSQTGRNCWPASQADLCSFFTSLKKSNLKLKKGGKKIVSCAQQKYIFIEQVIFFSKLEHMQSMHTFYTTLTRPPQPIS